MSDVGIRPARAADQPIIKAMIRAEHLDPSALDWSHFLIAERGTEIIGMGQMRPYPRCRELGSLVVKSTDRGTGVGSLLVNALLERESGDVYLDCRSHLETYYQRFGFTRIAWYQAPPPLKYKMLIAAVLLGAFGIHFVVMKRPAPVNPANSK